jgi:iron uptake system component EfeO
MTRYITKRAAGALLLTASLASAACGSNDDGAAVRDLTETSAASGAGASAAGGSSAGGSAASGSGLSTEGVTGTGGDNPLVAEAVNQYTAWVQTQIAQIPIEAKVFTDAVRAGDVDAAKAAYAPSRQSWERIEPIAGLIEQIDVAVDARVDDFASETDPTWTGWHKLEWLVFDQEKLDADASKLADQLDADLAKLVAGAPALSIPPVLVARGSAELIEEVANGKITGEEDRYSGTDLWDFAANLEGSKQAFDYLKPALSEVDAELATTVTDQFNELETELGAYRDGSGWKPYSTLTDADRKVMSGQLAALSESLATIPGVLGLS